MALLSVLAALCCAMALPAARAQAPEAAGPAAPAATAPSSSPPASPTSAPPSPPPGNDNQAGLERAQRLADNPLRHILRASRLPQRAAPPSAVAAPAAVQEVVRTITLPWSDSEASASAVPALDPDRLMATLELPSAGAWSALPALPQHDPLVPAPELPQLQSMVQPELDTRLRDQLGLVDPVDAVLTLRSDGTVAAVAFLGSVDVRLQRVLLRALPLWRYAPLRTAQDHRVRLEFPEER